MKSCPLCSHNIPAQQIVLENKFCLFIQREEPILMGSGLIIPRVHRDTVFELSAEEWKATQEIMHQAKIFLDERFRPSGYNLGWNCGATAGQETFHAHLHVIPRYSEEPLAGKGIRYWLKQEINRR